MASHLSFCVRERSVCIHRDSVQVAVQLVTGFVILKKERKEKKKRFSASRKIYDSLSFFLSLRNTVDGKTASQRTIEFKIADLATEKKMNCSLIMFTPHRD